MLEQARGMKCTEFDILDINLSACELVTRFSLEPLENDLDYRAASAILEVMSDRVWLNHAERSYRRRLQDLINDYEHPSKGI